MKGIFGLDHLQRGGLSAIIGDSVLDAGDAVARDMQWGQGVQLVDDYVSSEVLHYEEVDAGRDGCTPSVPLEVTKGEWIEIVIKFAQDGVLMQCLVERVDEAGNAVSNTDLNEDGEEGGECSDDEGRDEA